MRESWRRGPPIWGLGMLLAWPLLAAEPAEQEPDSEQDADAVLDADDDAEQPVASKLVTPADVTPPILQAVRKSEEFDFVYQSFSTFYSCSSLESKLKRILVALGADPGTRVRVSGCEFGGQIARLPVARIRTTIPVEATPAAFAELEKTRPQRELAARVRNDRKAGDIDAPFPAQWKRVSLSRGSLGIDSGDCELIEQLNRRVLPRLAVRVVDSKLACSPGRQAFTQPKLEVEALVEASAVTDAVSGKAADESARKEKKVVAPADAAEKKPT